MKIDEQLNIIAEKVKLMLKPHLIHGSKFMIVLSGKHHRVNITSERIYRNGRIEGEEREVGKV